MKSKPILFSPAMVRAILDGRKSQTRRVVKPQPSHIEWFQHQEGWLGSFGDNAGSRDNPHRMVPCPYGRPGDQLWVQESHRLRCPIEATESVECNYAEDGEQQMVPLQNSEWVKMMCRQNQVGADFGAIVPGRFMYRSLSRVTLEITGIRVERLQEISEADCCAEGIGGIFTRDCKKPKYRSLWESINGPESWSENPWVWVVEFKRIKP